jgi:signal transduction histidine kinase
LRVIDNASKWLEEDLQEHLTPETRENMNLLRGRVGRMEKLLDDLLEYSRIGRTVDERYAEIITGSAMMDNILTLLSPPTGFTVAYSPGFAGINVQRMPLQQILMNLVGNAIKHHDKKKGRIEVTMDEGETYYAFAVKDDGPGIAAQFHDQIFKMFHTLKPRDQVEGSGMGLAMVRKNVEVFGGTLNLDSMEGKGSVFRFIWPKQQRIKKEET